MSGTNTVRQVDIPTTGKTNERPGTRAMARHVGFSASKARVVLDLIRNKDVATADEILRFSERDAAIVIRKVLASAIANAAHNDDQIPEDLFVSACFADEGKTLRRMRPRARGRASRIRKRSCHITVIVSRMPEDELRERRGRQPGAADRRRRTAASKKAAARKEAAPVEEIEEVAEEAVEGTEVAPATGDTAEAEVAVPAPEPEAEAELEAAEDKEQDK